MPRYLIYVKYELPNGASMTEEFVTSVINPQYAKYEYHKYTHENYKSVSRLQEDDHIHAVGRYLTHTLEGIKELTQEESIHHRIEGTKSIKWV